MLLLLIFYIYGVMFTILFKGLYEPDGDGIITEPWFEGLAYSFFTLFQIMTFVSFVQVVFRPRVLLSNASVSNLSPGHVGCNISGISTFQSLGMDAICIFCNHDWIHRRELDNCSYLRCCSCAWG